MEFSAENITLRLKDSALLVLRRHGLGEEDLRLENNAPGKPPSCLILGHRIRIHVDDRSATLRALAGRWSARRADFPTTGAFVAALEAALHGALSGSQKI